MRRSKKLKNAAFIIPFVLLMILSLSGYAQEKDMATETLGKSPQTEAFDMKALEKLKSMSPEEVARLDKRLAEALTLFYDREYARALPIFKEISSQVETLDVIFWYGSCAAKAGESELAIEKFKKMLEVDPNLHRARLELATVYYDLGRYEDAKRELNTVLKARPPKTVEDNIRKIMSSIEAKTKKLFRNLRVSVGIQRDSDVNSAPDLSVITLPSNGGLFGTGGTLTLDTTQMAIKDWVLVDNFAGNLLYDFGDNKKWMGNVTTSFYQTHVSSHNELGVSQFFGSVGPWYVENRSIFKLPVGYVQNWYGHDKLYDSYSVSPSYEYYLKPNVSLKGTFTYSKDDYETADNRFQNNNNRIIEIGPNFFFNNRRDILSFSFSDENLDADAQRFSYDSKNATVSYYKLFRNDIEFYARFKHSRRDYLGPVPLWPYNREDRRNNFYALLSKNFKKHFFASISYNYIDNDSNTALYAFDKHVYGFNTGFKF